MEIDLNELEMKAKAAMYAWDETGRSSLAFVAAANPAVVLELVRRMRDAESEAVKSERRAIEFGDLLSQRIIAMRAAVVAGKLEGLEQGMQWIVNTLDGPGHLPDLDEARAKGGAQAMFDSEIAEHEEFRAAHPAPTIQPPKDEA